MNDGGRTDARIRGIVRTRRVLSVAHAADELSDWSRSIFSFCLSSDFAYTRFSVSPFLSLSLLLSLSRHFRFLFLLFCLCASKRPRWTNKPGCKRKWGETETDDGHEAAVATCLRNKQFPHGPRKNNTLSQVIRAVETAHESLEFSWTFVFKLRYFSGIYNNSAPNANVWSRAKVDSKRIQVYLLKM